jgi:hypothetical protein
MVLMAAAVAGCKAWEEQGCRPWKWAFIKVEMSELLLVAAAAARLSHRVVLPLDNQPDKRRTVT